MKASEPNGVSRLNYWIRQIKTKNPVEAVLCSKLNRGWLSRFSQNFKKEWKAIKAS